MKYENERNKSRLQGIHNAVDIELHHGQRFACGGISMVLTGPIGTVLTFATLATSNPGVKAFAVLFLALALFTVAALPLVPGMLQLVTDALPGLLQLVLMPLIVGTSIAIAILGAHLAHSEALAVHLEALGLLAGAAAPLLLGNGGRGGHLVVLRRHLLVDGEFQLVQLEQMLRNVLVEADSGGGGEILLRLDELKSVDDVGDGRKPEETLAKQVVLAHILYCSVKVIQFPANSPAINRLKLEFSRPLQSPPKPSSKIPQKPNSNKLPNTKINFPKPRQDKKPTRHT